MSECYAKVVGGLGNQLFQIAAGYAYSKKYDKEFYIDTSGWVAGQGITPLIYKDTIFKNFNYKSPITRDVIGISEKRFNYDEIPYHPGKITLHGYFQSLKYFEDIKDEFISLLELPEINNELINYSSVGIHMRRGDYLKYQNIYYQCDKNYFTEFFEEYKDKQIYVYTDSPEKVLEEFSQFDFKLVVGESELKDFASLSKHEIIIGSNSTFSWWASLIGNPKKTIFPSKWFVDRPHEDIYREDMILKNV